MIVLDASVVVSRLLPMDPHHAVSERWLTQQLSAAVPMVAPVLLLVEVGAAIARRTGDPALAEQAVAQLQRFPSLRLIFIDHTLGHLATRLAITLRLRGADALYVAAAHHLSLPLVSWNNEHHQRAGSLITVHFPAASIPPESGEEAKPARK